MDLWQQQYNTDDSAQSQFLIIKTVGQMDQRPSRLLRRLQHPRLRPVQDGPHRRLLPVRHERDRPRWQLPLRMRLRLLLHALRRLCAAQQGHRQVRPIIL